MSVGVRVTCVCVFVRVLSYVYDEELDNLTHGGMTSGYGCSHLGVRAETVLIGARLPVHHPQAARISGPHSSRG